MITQGVYLFIEVVEFLFRYHSSVAKIARHVIDISQIAIAVNVAHITVFIKERNGKFYVAEFIDTYLHMIVVEELHVDGCFHRVVA